MKHHFILFFILTLCFILCSSPSEALNAGKVEIKGLYSIEADEFLDMFGLRQGSVIDREKISNGIKRAFLKGLFDDISIEVLDGENPSVIINIIEKEFIKKISVGGSFQLSEKKIKELFSLKEDQVMRYDLVEIAINELKERLLLYGFPDAGIDLRIDKTDEPYRLNLYLTLNTGAPLITKKIKISAIPPLGNEKSLLSAMKLSEGDIYNQHILKDDLERIKKFYKKLGYFMPAAGPYSYSDGELKITVDPGRHMIITIEGNNIISTKKLLKEAPFFETGTFNDQVIEDAVNRMLSLYHKKGYPSAQIAPVIRSDEKNLDVFFFVFEGEKIKVRSIEFNGASLPHKKLKDFIVLKENKVYNPEFVERDRESLKEFYGALGYLEADVKEIETKIDEDLNIVDIIISIDEGKKTEIISLDITGTEPEMEERLMSVLGIKPGDPYNEVDISDARFRILDLYSNDGYTNIDVIVLRNIEDHRASIIFSVTEGKKRLFGKTIIAGNKKTRYKVIKRELLHKEDQPYSFRILENERQRLYKLGIFADIDIESVDGEGDKIDVLIKIREGNAGSVEFGFGYAEYERFRSFVELSYRNFQGMNRRGVLRAELSSLEQRYILQYHEPWFMGTTLPFRIFFLHENRKEINIDDGETRYRLERNSLTAGIEKKISDKMKTELYYEFSHVRTFDVQPDVVLTKEDTGTLAISSIRPAIVYDTRDNPFEPRKGVLAGISLKIASPLLFSETNFTKLVIYGSAFHRLIRRVTLAMSVRGGVAYGFGDAEELPLVERFFLGGRSTVRGYEQDTLGPKGSDGNPTGGNAFLMGNLELRTSIIKSIGLVTFLDMGNLWRKTKDIDPADLRYTTGIGLRYNTPVGPIRLDYGYKLDREHGESQSEIHFSIGHAF